MAPIDDFYCSVLDGTIRIRADAPEVRSRLEREFSPFYRITDEFESETLLGTVDARRVDHLPEFERDGGAEVLLHDGTYLTGKRRGREQMLDDGRRLIWSYDSGSLFELFDADRRASVFNTAAKSLSLDCRRIVRNQILVSWLEHRGGVSYHAAAFSHQGQGYMVAGDRGAGKTSVFLAALSTAGAGDTFGSGDRLVVLPDPQGPSAVAVPENINLFPGALLQFDSLASLADGADPGRLWERSEKRRFPWRTLFEAFGAQPAVRPLRIDVVLHPQWDSSVSSVVAEDLPPEPAARRLADNRISGVDSNRPNWLRWYDHEDDPATTEAMERLRHVSLRWGHVDHVRAWLTEQ